MPTVDDRSAPSRQGQPSRGRRRTAAAGTRSLTVEIPASLDPIAVERALQAHAADLARLAQIKGIVQEADLSFPPALLAAVADQEQRWRDIQHRYGLLTSADVAKLAGSVARNRAEHASNLRTKRQLLGALRRGRYVYPAFQFTESGR